MKGDRRLEKGILMLLLYCAIFFVPYYVALFYQIYQHWTQ
jgi:hypothetical protein